MKNDRINLQHYIFRIQLPMIIALAIVLGAFGIYINIREESKERDKNLQNVAETVAHIDYLSKSLGGAEEAPSPELTSYIDELQASLADIDVISVVGADNKRLYHTNHELIGQTFDGTMPDFKSNGDRYSVTDNGPSGIQRRAYAAIYSDDGKVSGFVMAIMLMSNIRARNIRVLIIFATVVIIAILIELLISYRISRRVRGTLMGYEPDAFSSMFKIRENILESLEEGIIAVSKGGDVEYMNKAATTMLTGGGHAEGTHSEGMNSLTSTILKDEKEFSIPLNTSADLDIIMDRIPVKDEDEVDGAIGILHNRTEYTRLAEDLAGTKHLVDSMRANNHDFTNKLHVILGLLQMEMYDQATDYIENITVVQSEGISEIMRKVNVPSVAALLIGKNARASELNVKFIFKSDSVYNREDIYIPDGTLITVIGNLIDNALDSMNVDAQNGGRPKELWFGIYSNPGALLITVDDTGSGISKGDIDHIFDDGFSTKSEGRGTGLHQVKNLVESLGGKISVQSQENSGTSFTVSFTEGA